MAGDGSLRQWQIHNQINHLACIPHSFFAVRAESGDDTAVTRVLQSEELYGDNTPEPPPTSNDHVIPLCHRRLMQKLPGVESTAFSGTYPIAKWNSFLWPLTITTDSDKWVVQIAISSFQQQYSSSQNYIMAASVVVAMPTMVLFLFFQRQLVESIKTSRFK